MHASTFILAFASLVAARNCTPGLNYCGKTLRKIANGNNYDAQIDQAMRDAHRGNENSDEAVFRCLETNNPNGDIYWWGYCKWGCVDGGGSNNDYCRQL